MANFALGAGKRLSIDDLILISSPIFNCLAIEESALSRIDEIWKNCDESKLVSLMAPDSSSSVPVINDASTCLANSITRSGLVCRIMSLLAGRTPIRSVLISMLTALVNNQLTPILSSVEAAAEELIAFFAGNGSASAADGVVISAVEALTLIGSQPLILLNCERHALLGYPFISIGLACVVVGSTNQVVKSLDALTALSCEAAGCSLEPFDPTLYETHRQHRGQIQSATNLKALFDGSKRVIARAAVDARHAALHSIPQSNGPALEALAAACKALDIELNSSEVLALDVSQGMVSSSSQALASLAAVTNIIQELIQASQQRMSMITSISGVSGATYIGQKSLQSVAFAPLLALLEQVSLEVSTALQALHAYEQSAVESTDRVGKDKIEVVEGRGKPVADESALSDEQRAKAEAKRKLKADKAAAKAAAKEQRKASNLVIGGGSTAVRAALLSAIGGAECVTAGALLQVLTPPALYPQARARAQPVRPHLLDQIPSLLDALHLGGKRKPKIAKGARDFTPEQMRVREQAFSTIRAIFKRHGGVEIDTPVFELKEVLMGKYGEDSKLIYDLADQGGELLSLRYDLTVPFARFLAMNSVGNIKRYHMAKVYRRDNPQLAKGRYREFYQCDFDIAGAYNAMVPDAEVISIAAEILSALPIGDFLIKLNHRKLLDAVFELAGVPANQFRSICSAVDKLDKMTWEEVKHEMVHEKHLPDGIADKIGTFVLYSGEPLQLWNQLSELGLFRDHVGASEAMHELQLLFSYLQAMGSLQYISFDLSLARGLDYYTGVIYEAVLVSSATQSSPALQMGSIAAGGRYDQLVGMFSPSGTQTPCVGISIGVERVFTLMERRADALQLLQRSQIQVYIASIGADLLLERMKVARVLWQANIAAEYSHLDNPKFKRQLDEALERGIPFMLVFGSEELEAGQVKVKDMLRKEEVLVQRERVVGELVQRGCRLLSAGDDSFIQAMKAADEQPAAV
jgi:histidyl-tRNA synthetase